MDKRFLIMLGAVVALFIGIFIFTGGRDNQRSGSDGQASQRSQNYFGKLDSKVTITEFVDFQCEACYAYYPFVKQLKEKYKASVKFEIRNFPIEAGHQFARMAARSAEAAALQGKFWEMHDKIFEGQKIWERAQNPKQEFFDNYAEEIGLDMTKYQKDYASAAVNNVINADLADVKKLGGTGTPTFAVNGEKVENPKPSLEALSKMVDDALKKSNIQ